MAEPKTKVTPVNVDEFLSQVQPPTRQAEGNGLCELMKSVTGETPRMWGPSIIGFGQHHYRYESGREGNTLRIGFSPRKPALVLYGLGIERQSEALTRLGKHTTGKGCLYIKRLSDIDLRILKEMITKAWSHGAVEDPN
jgi:Domain of unknown function (DU1801)